MSPLDALAWLGIAALAGLGVLLFILLLGAVKYALEQATKGGDS